MSRYEIKDEYNPEVKHKVQLTGFASWPEFTSNEKFSNDFENRLERFRISNKYEKSLNSKSKYTKKKYF